MILADTGPLVAGANSRDRHHQVCADLLVTHPGPILVPAPVVVEVCQLLASRRDANVEAAFLTSLGLGALRVIDLEPADHTRSAALVTQYADLPLGAVDASVIAVAERLRVTEVATLDRRHFSVVRPAHTEAFSLLPTVLPSCQLGRVSGQRADGAGSLTLVTSTHEQQPEKSSGRVRDAAGSVVDWLGPEQARRNRTHVLGCRNGLAEPGHSVARTRAPAVRTPCH